jgi:hypothetical protein
MRQRAIVVLLALSPASFAQPIKPLAETWDYAPAMKKVAAKFKGAEGVGGSMTIANPYTVARTECQQLLASAYPK